MQRQYYFISYIWWHRKHPDWRPNFEETVTDKTPIKWLIDTRKESERLAKEGKNDFEKAGEVFHIIFYASISESEYKLAKSVALGE